jgi:hypothetical protein
MKLRPTRQLAAAARPWLWVALVAAAALPAAAQTGAGPGIYTCIDANGRRLTADRPIAECRHKEQQILNRDGSVRGVLPPTLTAEERAEKEARDRAEREARAAQADAVRRDRNLMARFPDEAAHQRAREAALDNVRLAIRNTELRLRELQAERKPLMDETEFYVGRALPPKLKSAIDANDAAAEAQRAAAATQQAELNRINRMFDGELERLRRLWAGAPPGSMGPLMPPSAAPLAPVNTTRPAPSSAPQR